MKEQDTLQLYRSRSYRGIVVSGFRFYARYFRTLFKASAATAALYSLVAAAFVYAATARAGGFPVALILLALLLCSESLVIATVFDKLREFASEGSIAPCTTWLKPRLHLWKRSLTGVWLTALSMLAVAAALTVPVAALMVFMQPASPVDVPTTPDGGTPSAPIAATWTMAVLLAAVIAFTIPLIYSFTAYMTDGSRSFGATLRKHFPSAMRHWGKLFIVLLLSVTAVEFAGALIMLPATILAIAHQTAAAGAAMGDPTAMPSYMPLLTIVTLGVCIFLKFYVSMVTTIHILYIYGDLNSEKP